MSLPQSSLSSLSRAELPRYVPATLSNGPYAARTLPVPPPSTQHSACVTRVSTPGKIRGALVVLANGKSPLEVVLDGDAREGEEMKLMLERLDGMSVLVHTGTGSFTLQYPDTERHLIFFSGAWRVFGWNPYTYRLYPDEIDSCVKQQTHGMTGFGYSLAYSGDGTVTTVSEPERLSGTGGLWIYTSQIVNNETIKHNGVFLSSNRQGVKEEGRVLAMNSAGTILAFSSRIESTEELLIYERTNGKWSPVHTIEGDVASAAISSDGNKIVIGAVGAIKMYARNGNVWDLDCSAEDPEDALFGTRVAINGLGNIFGTVSSRYTVVVFEADYPEVKRHNLSDQYKQGAPAITGATAIAIDFLGHTIVAGSDETNGRISVFTASTSNGKYMVRPDPHFDRDNIINNMYSAGHSLALSADGNTLIVGAPKYADARGAVFIFTRTGQTWTLRTKLEGEPGAVLGHAVCISTDGGSAVVSALGTGEVHFLA
jgi:hypothetical protein